MCLTFGFETQRTLRRRVCLDLRQATFQDNKRHMRSARGQLGTHNTEAPMAHAGQANLGRVLIPIISSPSRCRLATPPLYNIRDQSSSMGKQTCQRFDTTLPHAP